MRVLYCIETFLPHIGGAQVLAYQFVSAMRNRGHEIAIVTSMSTLDQNSESTLDNIPVYRFPFFKVLAERNIVQIAETKKQVSALWKSFHPDLVHLNSTGPDNFFYLQESKAFSTPILVTLHGLPMSSHFDKDDLFHVTLRAASWITIVSEAVLSKARKISPDITSRSSVIYNGLKPPQTRPNLLNFDQPVLLGIGRLFPHKGFDLAVSSFSGIAHRFPMAQLIIAGDGPSRTDLEEQTKCLQLTSRVSFKGWIPPENISELINQATIIIMPSRREPFGLVALQAGQMARPIVATRVDGLPEVVRHNETGLLVESEDSQAIATAITYLLEHPKQAIQMGQRAKQWVQKAFSFERHLDEYEKLYQNLANTTHD